MLLAAEISAQRDFPVTQYMYNTLLYNPAYASAKDTWEASVLVKDQWSGLDGSPQSQALQIHSPNYGNAGYGLTVINEKVGIQSRLNVTGAYGYKLRSNTSALSLGLSASFQRFVNDFTDDRLNPIQGFANDPAIDEVKLSKTLFNLGFGAYYEKAPFHFGLSIPAILKSNLDDDGYDVDARATRYLLLTTGFDIRLSEKLLWQPRSLLRLAAHLPYDLELTSNFVLMDQYHMGINVSAGGSQDSFAESVDVLLGFDLTDQIFLGMSYDLTLSDLREYENGSVELFLRYAWQRDNKPRRRINPRYF